MKETKYKGDCKTYWKIISVQRAVRREQRNSRKGLSLSEVLAVVSLYTSKREDLVPHCLVSCLRGGGVAVKGLPPPPPPNSCLHKLISCSVIRFGDTQNWEPCLLRVAILFRAWIFFRTALFWKLDVIDNHFAHEM